jgi:glutathione S-transferase/GST-like protein
VHTHNWSGVTVDDLPHLQRWLEVIAARPAVQRGIIMPPRAERIDTTSVQTMLEQGQSR